MKNRKRQRENRKEANVNKRRATGIKDLTPYNAVRLMRGGKNNTIAYK
jgi:hypothetical protein